MIGLCNWVGGFYFYIGPLTVGYRDLFEHWGWWGKAFYAGHFYITWIS